MDNPLHAAHYADCAKHTEVEVLLRRELAHETYLVRVGCSEIASQIRPGQFIMVRQPNSAEPLLGRAFALYDVIRDESGKPYAIDFVFHIVGKMTRLLSQVDAGDRLIVWGPLGNGFPAEDVEHLVMVAGGIGQTPFLALAKSYLGVEDFGSDGASPKANKVTLCYGARAEKYLAGLDDFAAAGINLKISTDDGSAGEHGLVTDSLRKVLDGEDASAIRVVCCGPEKMMEAVSELCAEKGVRCQVSLETPMACGIGICFSCVARVRQEDGTWDFKRTCVDGPVFESTSLVW